LFERERRNCPHAQQRERHDYQDAQADEELFPVGRNIRIIRRRFADIAQMALAILVGNQADHHTDAGDAETQVPVDILAEVSADQWP